MLHRFAKSAKWLEDFSPYRLWISLMFRFL
jgi:hypothetical protein